MEGFPTELAVKLQPVRLIGEGGMGRVFHARDRVLGRDVAVKLTLPTGARDPETLRARFQREARLLAAFDHPNVLKIHDFGETDSGELYMITQLVRGQSLYECLPVEDPLRTLEPIGSALEHLHAAGVVHRDVKPGNIMVQPDGTSVLVDFGLARGEDLDTLTRTGAIAGTVQYLAPEVFLGNDADPPADWWAWGISLFQALEGRYPFSNVDILAMTEGQEPEPPRFETTDPRSRAALAVVACLEPDPARRPTSLAQLHGRVEALSRPRPSTGSSSPGGSALSSQALRRGGSSAASSSPAPDARRTRRALGAGAGLLAALVAGAAFLGGADPTPPPEEPPTSNEETSNEEETYQGPLPGEAAAAPREAMRRAAESALEGHGVALDASLLLDPPALRLDRRRDHLDALGWTAAPPPLDGFQRLASAVTAWLRRLRDWEKDSGGEAFRDPEVRERARTYAHGALLHLARDLRAASLLPPVVALGGPDGARFRREVQGALADLRQDLWIWPEESTPPLVHALQARVVALAARDTPELGPSLTAALELLAQAPPARDGLATAVLDLLEAAWSDASLGEGTRARAHERLHELLATDAPELDARGRARLRARAVLEEVRAARNGFDDPWARQRLLDLARALAGSEAGEALLPEVRALAGSLTTLENSLLRIVPEDRARARRLAGALDEI